MLFPFPLDFVPIPVAVPTVSPQLLLNLCSYHCCGHCVRFTPLVGDGYRYNSAMQQRHDRRATSVRFPSDRVTSMLRTVVAQLSYRSRVAVVAVTLGKAMLRG